MAPKTGKAKPHKAKGDKKKKEEKGLFCSVFDVWFNLNLFLMFCFLGIFEDFVSCWVFGD